MGKSHIEVVPDDPSGNPHCRFHGPAIWMKESFDDGSPTRTFLACSANRDRSKCPIQCELQTPNQTMISEQFELRYAEHSERLGRILAAEPESRGYCGQCTCLVVGPELDSHRKHRDFRCDFSDRMIKCPTTLLAPLDNDTQEAQYFFSEQTLECLGSIFHKLGLRKVICIGAPRLHEFLRFHRARFHIASVLLDLDRRLEQFYGRDELFMFNMFNHHFMDGSMRQTEFEEFLRDSSSANGRTLLFTDPPFGCRTELLALTITTIARRHQTLNALLQQPLPTMWIFPYFMETYVQQAMPEMQMLAYRVNYTNHRTYHAAIGGRKQGSPIRIFTNIPLDQLPLPTGEGYARCLPCRRWTASGEQHCAQCGDCPSKNGASYVHCERCATCVKPNYKHCEQCSRCTQVVGHVCAEYVRHLSCWICRRKGHNERGCTQWLSLRKTLVARGKVVKTKGNRVVGRLCLVCDGRGHNERRCPKRGPLLAELGFMGDICNIFTQK